MAKRSPENSCIRCGQKAIKWITDPDGTTVPLCKGHLNIEPCSVCGSFKHSPGQAHPSFWATKNTPQELVAKLGLPQAPVSDIPMTCDALHEDGHKCQLSKGHVAQHEALVNGVVIAWGEEYVDVQDRCGNMCSQQYHCHRRRGHTGPHGIDLGGRLVEWTLDAFDTAVIRLAGECNVRSEVVYEWVDSWKERHSIKPTDDTKEKVKWVEEVYKEKGLVSLETVIEELYEAQQSGPQTRTRQDWVAALKQWIVSMEGTYGKGVADNRRGDS